MIAGENANTADLTDSEKLNAILRRLGALEAQAAERAREARSKLDLIIAELADLRDGQKDAVVRFERIEARLDPIEKQLRVMTQDIMQVRTDQQSLEDRMDAIGRRPN